MNLPCMRGGFSISFGHFSGDFQLGDVAGHWVYALGLWVVGGRGAPGKGRLAGGGVHGNGVMSDWGVCE